MIYTILGCFVKRSSISDAEEVASEQLKVTKAVYRDELVKTKPPLPCKAVKKSVRFADSEPSILGRGEEKEELLPKGGKERGIRVKVKMTREEAVRLLSKCKEGGVLEFKDVARELVSIPVSRVCVVSDCTKQL